MVLSLTVEWGVGMERQGPSYGEVVNTRDVRVQALLGGSKISEPGGGRVDYVYMSYRVPNPSTSGGGGLYRGRQDPSQPTYQRVKVH